MSFQAAFEAYQERELPNLKQDVRAQGYATASTGVLITDFLLASWAAATAI